MINLIGYMLLVGLVVFPAALVATSGDNSLSLDCSKMGGIN